MNQNAGLSSDLAEAKQIPGKLFRSHYIHTLWVQGMYYLLTGMWPLVSIGSFQMVTGEKTDVWLVHTVGALIAVIAIVLLIAASRQDRWPEVGFLALGSAFVLLAIDVIYVTRGVIPPIYLADAAIELVLLSWWLVILTRRSKQLPF